MAKTNSRLSCRRRGNREPVSPWCGCASG
jgi:hypothetical protein